MMGVHQKQTELWVDPVNLARRIPEDHFLRKLNKTLDLSFVREEVSKSYGRNGNVSVDPVVIMKMMLLLFLDNVSSERELMRVIPLRIDYLWYLGYGLEDEVPTHSVLSKARRRWGAEVFERLFKLTVAKCLAAGLIDGSKVHVDSSNIRANASKNSIVEIACGEALGRLDEAAPEADAESKPKVRGRVNRSKMSTTDPDATLVRQGGAQSEPSYKNHRVVDDKAGVVTAIKSTTGAVNEAHELVGLIREHEANTGHAAAVVVADCKYGTAENFVALAQQNIATHNGRPAFAPQQPPAGGHLREQPILLRCGERHLHLPLRGAASLQAFQRPARPRRIHDASGRMRTLRAAQPLHALENGAHHQPAQGAAITGSG